MKGHPSVQALRTETSTAQPLTIDVEPAPVHAARAGDRGTVPLTPTPETLESLPDVSAPWSRRLVADERLRVLSPRAAGLIGDALARVLSLVPATRRRAGAELRMVISAGALAMDESAAAERWWAALIERLYLLFRPRSMERAVLQDLSRLHAAQAEGRGVLLVFCHTGHYPAVFPALRNAGVHYVVPATEAAFGGQVTGLLGLVIRQHVAYAMSGGGEVICASSGASARMRNVLQTGGTVLIAVDVVGRTPTRLLGRTVGMASGAARLALETEARVLPVRTSLDRSRNQVVVELGKPIDIRPRMALKEAQARIAAVVEEQYGVEPWNVDAPRLRPLVP